MIHSDKDIRIKLHLSRLHMVVSIYIETVRYIQICAKRIICIEIGVHILKYIQYHIT